MIKQIKAWGVFFSSEPDKMVATDNKRIFKPYAIFATRNEAMEWRKEKYMGGAEARVNAAPIKQVVILLPQSKIN